MIPKNKIIKINEIWDCYIQSDMTVIDTKGNKLPQIDELRINAIKILQNIIKSFLKKEISIGEFKTSIDSFNKKNNLWGFTAIKGQFFFNQLTKNLNENGLSQVSNLLIDTISEPENIDKALNKIEKLEKYCQNIYSYADDKRYVPNPKSVGYFLSYFWQIFNYEKWPIYYTSLIQSFNEIGIWNENLLQRENYEKFFFINEEIRLNLETYAKRKISNWDIEHAFWYFRGNPNKKMDEKNKEFKNEIIEEKENEITIRTSFDLSGYIIPKVSDLLELQNISEKSNTKKAYEYEQKVSEVFELLDFEVEKLGQGKGRNPDAILRYRKENIAFIVDAKAYNNGYSLGTDNRAIKEYIHFHCPILQKDGYKKIGFIIVSNEFKSNFDNFVNEITWETDIKRFILLTSEALLYLLAYKTKNKLNLQNIIESLINLGNPISAKDIIEEFDDV